MKSIVRKKNISRKKPFPAEHRSKHFSDAPRSTARTTLMQEHYNDAQPTNHDRGRI